MACRDLYRLFLVEEAGSEWPRDHDLTGISVVAILEIERGVEDYAREKPKEIRQDIN